jgi:hypothetical protein
MDIWTFGCLVCTSLCSVVMSCQTNVSQVFELVTNHRLFEFKPYPLLDLDETSYILWQMMSYTVEEFLPEQLSESL